MFQGKFLDMSLSNSTNYIYFHKYLDKNTLIKIIADGYFQIVRTDIR